MGTGAGKNNKELSDIFAEVKIGKYVVKPWTTSQFIKLIPIIKLVSDSLLKQGIDISQQDLQDFSLDMNLTAGEIMKYLTIAMDVIGPIVPNVVSVSVRIEIEEAEEMEWGESLAIMANVLVLNWDHIKNWLGQMLGKKLNLGLASTKKDS